MTRQQHTVASLFPFADGSRVDGARSRRMPVAGKVNESLSKTMSYKGPDGLTDDERRAYETCKPLSCKHEACYKRFMYSAPKRQQEECGPLMQEWRACFKEALARAAQQGPAR